MRAPAVPKQDGENKQRDDSECNTHNNEYRTKKEVKVH